MADLDLARIKRNVAKMASMNAPVAHIDGYIASEGATVEAIRAFRMPKMTADATGQRFDESGVPVGGVPMAEPEASAQPQAEKFGGVAMNATAGVNEALYGVAGLPVDAMRGAMNLGVRGFNAATGADVPQIPENSFGGSRSIAEAAGTVAPELDPRNTEAQTSNDRLARGVGQGVGGSVAPAGVVGGLQRAGVQVSPLVQALAGRSNSGAAVAADATAGAAAGGGSALAQELAPEKYKPAAALAGGIVGGGLGAVATGIPGLARVGAEAAGDFIAPLTERGREGLAASRLREAASDPRAAVEAIDNAPAPAVPGSRPTTFQQTGDMGLGALERDMQTRYPADFQQRRAEQNSARRDAIDAIQPAGAAEQVSRMLKERVDAIDAEFDANMAKLNGREREATDAIGRGQDPEVAGGTMRTGLQSARDTAKEREKALWEAVDPDGTLALPATNARAYIRERLAQIPASARPPGGEEAAIHAVLRQYGDVSSFREVQALQSRLKTAMRAERENGETPAYARMSELNGALFRDLETAAIRKVEQQAEAVSRGEMRVEDTVEAYLLREQQRWTSERQRATGTVSSSGASGFAGGRTQGVSGSRRAEGAPGSGLGSPPGDPRLSGDGLQPNFSDAALGRLNAARDATNDRAGTFDNSTLKPMLRRPATNAPYQMRDASVPKNLFTAGAGSFEKIQTFRTAVNNDPAALGALEGFVIDNLRKAAIDRDTGAINPTKLEGWRRSHADALRAFPELDIKIGNAVDAGRAVERQALAHKAALDNEQRGAFGRLIGTDDPQDVVRIVGGLFSRQDSAAQLAALRRRTGGDAAARDGLRKAVADHVTSKLVSNTEAATSGRELLRADQFQTFVKQNRNALRAVFTEKEVAVLDAVAADLQRGNRSLTAVRIPGQSNTAQDQNSVLRQIMAGGMENWLTVAGGGVGAAVGGASGAVAGGGAAALFNAMRLNGIASVDELVRDAMLNPERARFLMAKVPREPAQADAMMRALARRYVKAATVGAAVEPREEAPRRGPMQLPPWMQPPEQGTALQRTLAGRQGAMPPWMQDFGR